MIKRITALLAFLLLFLNSASYSWAETNRYVTDDLTIPMRSGTTTSHKILKFLKSGTKVVIKETTEDGLYSWLMTITNWAG